MTLAQPTGGWNCCCPDCAMLVDTADCCLVGQDSGSQGRCDRTVEIVEGAPDKVGCCIDQTSPTFDTIPTKTLDYWRELSGDWWKNLSPDPRYALQFGDLCNDGALWELSGNGEILGLVGWPNPGYNFSGTTLGLFVGLDVTFTLGCDGNGAGGIAFRIFCDQYEVDPVGHPNGNYKLTFTFLDKTVTIWTNNFRNTLSVCINGDYGLIAAGWGSVYGSPDAFACVGAPAGCKIKITNASSRVMAFDDIYWGKQYVYRTQEWPPCPSCGNCRCDVTDDEGHRWRAWPRTFYVKLVYECVDGTYTVCNTMVNRQVCDWLEAEWASEEPSVLCNGIAFDFKLLCSGVNLLLFRVEYNPSGILYFSDGLVMPANCMDERINWRSTQQSFSLCGCYFMEGVPIPTPVPGRAWFYVSETPFDDC